MTDMYKPPDNAVETTGQVAKPLELETKIAEAQPAAATTAPEARPGSDQAELKAALPADSVNRVTALETRVADAARAGSDQTVVKATDTADKQTAVPGQMTDTPHFNQGKHPDCLLQSARMAETRQTGVDPGLETYKKRAIEQDNYCEKAGKGGVTDLEKFAAEVNTRPGLKAEYHSGATLEDIKSALDKKESVIVGVNAAKFYPEAGLQDDGSGHAVVVTGATQAADGTWKVTVNDPNDLGPNTVVDEKAFSNAWKAFDSPILTVAKR